jgi:hypothetical protein
MKHTQATGAGIQSRAAGLRVCKTTTNTTTTTKTHTQIHSLTDSLAHRQTHIHHVHALSRSLAHKRVHKRPSQTNHTNTLSALTPGIVVSPAVLLGPTPQQLPQAVHAHAGDVIANAQALRHGEGRAGAHPPDLHVSPAVEAAATAAAAAEQQQQQRAAAAAATTTTTAAVAAVARQHRNMSATACTYSQNSAPLTTRSHRGELG